MDKGWINQCRSSTEYRRGVEEFLEFAFRNASDNGKIMCPCVKCVNGSFQTLVKVREHLVCDGFQQGYTRWIFHGEEFNVQPIEPRVVERNSQVPNNIAALVHDALGFVDRVNDEVLDMDDGGGESETEQENDGEHFRGTYRNGDNEFQKVLEDVNEELYLGCKSFSKLSFILHLYHLKCLNGWTNKSFSMLLELLIDAFPKGVLLPKSFYESKKLIQALGLDYEKIHSCPNHCMLFWGDDENEISCRICGSSRWAVGKGKENVNSSVDVENPSPKRKKIPAKILRYFPLIPRLQRLFFSIKTANDMRWHEECRKKDGLLRHPADGEAWKAFDARYPDFASDPRNVRLALSSDGFNPFRTLSTSYSTWPVLLMTYNISPWSCMKQSSFILSMIIPGEKGPGNKIDTYLQPLIQELKQLWDGVDTYDRSRNQFFKMRAALMWTINDFPAYGYLSGWSTKGQFGCPYCAETTDSKWLQNGVKHCYMGHRRWLPDRHPFRYQKELFDGKEEHRKAPVRASGTDVVIQLDAIDFTINAQRKKTTRKRRGEDLDDELNAENVEDANRSHAMGWWKKKSIFFMLPYWEFNLLRHNLDVMHIEKNICDNLVGTLLNLEKSKDNLKARLDLMEMNIRFDLHPQEDENGRYKLPPACFNMTKKEKDIFCQVLKNTKLPDGYASNISRCINLKEHKIFGLKSHDCHVLIQYLLPIALRACSPSKQITAIVIEIAYFFKSICSKVIDVNELAKVQERIALTLCNMEKSFLPSFFTIMPHLMVHLIDEVKLGGPVQYRWMFPLERNFVGLKSSVRNKARPEGSMAEWYIAQECLVFCSRYLEGVETKFNRPLRNPDPPRSEIDRYLFSSAGQTIGKGENFVLDDLSLLQAHRYVLRHCDEIEPFRR